MATLVYYQRKQRIVQEFESFDAALDFAAFGAAYETLAADEIRDDERVVAGSALDDLCWEREKALGLG